MVSAAFHILIRLLSLWQPHERVPVLLEFVTSKDRCLDRSQARDVMAAHIGFENRLARQSKGHMPVQESKIHPLGTVIVDRIGPIVGIAAELLIVGIIEYCVHFGMLGAIPLTLEANSFAWAGRRNDVAVGVRITQRHVHARLVAVSAPAIGGAV